MDVKLTKYIIADKEGKVLCKCLRPKEHMRNAFIDEGSIGKRSSGYGNPLTFNHYAGAIKNLRQYRNNGDKRQTMLSEAEVSKMIESGEISIRRVTISFSDSEHESGN